MEHDAKGKAALLAAVSALGVSLGVSLVQPAAAAESSSKPKSQQVKMDSAYLKGSQIKYGSQQLKGESQQLKLDSAHVKGESQQIKYGSQQLKLDSQHVKGESQQLKLDKQTSTTPQ